MSPTILILLIVFFVLLVPVLLSKRMALLHSPTYAPTHIQNDARFVVERLCFGAARPAPRSAPPPTFVDPAFFGAVVRAIVGLGTTLHHTTPHTVGERESEREGILIPWIYSGSARHFSTVASQ